MKHHHTLAAVALAAAAGGAAAQGNATSNVTIYGIIDAAVRHATNAGAPSDPRTTMEDGIYTGSRLGFRGQEDLGGGLRAVFTLESGFDPSAGTSSQGSPTADYGQVGTPDRMWGRQVFVGLRNSWGGISLGRQYTVAHQLAARFQPLGNPNSTAHSLFSSHHIARQDNMVQLDGKFGGVELLLARTFGEQVSTSANAATGLGIGYTGGPLQLGAYLQQMDNLAGTETRKIVGAGGNYKLNPTLALFGGLMRRSTEVSPQRNRAFTLGANVEVASNVTLSAAYYDDKQSGSAALDGARKVMWLTANYRFSKRSDVYAVVDRNRVTGGYAKPAFMGAKGTQHGLVVGLRHRF